MRNDYFDIRPGKMNYWLSALIIIIGIAGFIFLIGKSIVPGEEKMRFVLEIGEEYDIEFEEAGKYTIFYEYDCYLDEGYDNAIINDISVLMRSPSRGEMIEVAAYPGMYSYTYGNRKSVAFRQLIIPEAGLYEFYSTFNHFYDKTGVLVMAEAGGETGLFLNIIKAFIVLISAGIIGLALFMYTFIKRKKVIDALSASQ